MTLVFPRDMTSAYEWEKADLSLAWRQESSQQAGGTMIGKDLGSPVWKAQYETMPLEKHLAEALHTDFLTLGGLARTFFAHVAIRPEPLAMPGAALSGVTVRMIANDRSSMKLQGLADRQVITAGDFIAITTANGGRELVKAASTVEVGSNGRTDEFEVTPYLRAGVALNDVVDLAPPMIELRLEKDGLQDPKRKSGNLYTVSFKASQVIR
ncbi:hypothetical protein [uncultured Planktomarina sp.]|uniref:hypothetical protein n=1 Tax=uncultured Planktomarina sp. TaxID=1538529 RepID=UPI00326114D5